MSLAVPMIETDRELEKICAQFATAKSLAIDTEFMRERTFSPKLGLIQVSDGETHVLIDPLAVDSLRPFLDLLSNTDILKILHAPREDLEIFFNLSGELCEPLFDTQTAASFVGHGHSMSYQNLVRDLLGKTVQKVQTRTDWLRRPLSDAQMQYAILDVVHLHPMVEILSRQLDESGRREWVEQEFRTLERIARDDDPMAYYRRVKQCWRLTRRQLGVLQLLCAWREEQAFERDVLRPSVVPDDALLDLARMQPTHRNELRSLKRLHPREISRSGDAILATIRKGKGLSDAELPPSIPSPVSDPALLARVDFLTSAIRIRAMALRLSPEILARKKALEELVKRHTEGAEDPFPEVLQGWRKEILGDYLLRLLDGKIAFRINPEDREPPLEMVELTPDS